MATKRGSIKQNKWTVSQEHLENFTVPHQGTKNSTSLLTSLTKQTTFRDATGGFPAKWRLRNERRNSRHYTDPGNASDWLMQISQTARPIRSTTQIWVVTRHQYGISALISQTGKPPMTSRNFVCFLRITAHRFRCTWSLMEYRWHCKAQEHAEKQDKHVN